MVYFEVHNMICYISISKSEITIKTKYMNIMFDVNYMAGILTHLQISLCDTMENGLDSIGKYNF